MADGKISVDPNLASPAAGDQLAIVDIDVADSLKNKTVTWSQIEAAYGGTFDHGTTLSAADVFSAIGVTNGLVTGITTRALTPANIGAIDDVTVDAGSGLTVSGSTTLTLGFQSSLIAERTGTLVGTDRLTGATGTTDFCETISGIPLSIFNDDLGYTNYTLPAATITVRGGIELEDATVQTTAANAVSSTASRSYGLQVNAAAQGIVNIPWTDTVSTLISMGVNATAAELNILDLSATALTTGWVYRATGASTAAWGILTHANLGSVSANQHIDWTSAPADDFESTGIDDNATATAITIDASENVGIELGDIRMLTAGKGIDFSGIGTAAEILDYYEEGTWTPVISDNEGPPNTATMLIQTGIYTKVGRLVTIQARIKTQTNLNGLTLNTRITGLPFASENVTNQTSAVAVGTGLAFTITAGGTISGYIGANASHILLRLWDAAAGTSALQGSEFTVNSDMTISGQYILAT